MLADFTVLGMNPFDVSADRIKDIPVKGVYLGGKQVF
jgi:predicted amidohydrolase YtcJ